MSEWIEIEVEEYTASSGNTCYSVKCGALGLLRIWPAGEFNGKPQPARAQLLTGGKRDTASAPAKQSQGSRPVQANKPTSTALSDDPLPDFVA